MSGLGSFIKGAFEGYEYGENVKDRKTQRKRNEKRWEWEQENQDWKRENNEWTQENRDWTRTQRERQREAWQRKEAERERMADIYDESRDSFESGQQTPPPGQVETTSTRESQPPERGVTDDAPTRPQARPRTVAPQPSVSSEGPMQQQPPAPGQSPQVPPQAANDGRAFDPMRGKVQPDPIGRPPQPGQNVPHRDTQTADPAQSGQPNDVTRTSMAVEYDAPEQIVRLARETDGLETALRTGVYPNSGNQPLTDSDRRMFAQMVEQNDKKLMLWAENAETQSPGVRYSANQIQHDTHPTQQAVQSGRSVIGQNLVAPNAGPAGNRPQSSPDANNRVGSTQRTAPPPPQKPGAPGSAPVVGNLDVRSASTGELDQQATENPPDKGGAPSVESAGEAMEKTASTSKGVVGPGTKKVNPKDEERASKNFLDHYAKTAVPKVVDYYLSQGNVEKAKAFETWAKSRKVKGQMESWSKAIWAITNGDEDRFIDHISDTYNAIDDGLSINREKSKFIHDEQGNIIGGQLAVVNDETGEVSIQNFDDQQDIVEMAIYSLAPEQTFEYLYKMSEQAREMRIEAASGDGISRKDMAEMIADEADSIRSAQGNILDPKQRIGEDEIERRARENVYRRLGVSTGASTGQSGGGGNLQEPPRL